MPPAGRALTGQLPAQRDPLSCRRIPELAAYGNRRFRICRKAERTGAYDTYVAAQPKSILRLRRMVTGKVARSGMHKFQLVGVDDHTLKVLEASRATRDRTLNQIMDFLRTRGYVHVLIDRDAVKGRSSVMFVMRRVLTAPNWPPPGLQQSDAFVRQLPFRQCLTY